MVAFGQEGGPAHMAVAQCNKKGLLEAVSSKRTVTGSGPGVQAGRFSPSSPGPTPQNISTRQVSCFQFN